MARSWWSLVNGVFGMNLCSECGRIRKLNTIHLLHQSGIEVDNSSLLRQNKELQKIVL